jgi:NAD(P)-dependent dehydrogenase (short-subunit alcohol dehydrogenase family)
VGELVDRVALVTGASSGIGAAVAARFRGAGARVAGLDVNSGMSTDFDSIVDLRSGTAVRAAVAAVAGRLGPPDVVVHAAAATSYGGCLDTQPETFLDLYDVNLVGAVRLLQECVPVMQARSGGAFLFLSSINADFATPTLAAYAATKAALENLVKTAAVEFAADNIRVNAIAPASIETPAMRGSFERAEDPAAAREQNIRRHPLARLGTAEEVAELALFLVSDRAGWITGSTYRIDGGASATRR